MTVLHRRKEFNTSPQGSLWRPPEPPTINNMAKKPPTFKELIEAAARPYRELWRGDKLNLGALSRRCEAKGHPLSQASLSRILRGLQEVGPDAIEATHHALGIPKALLRGEAMSSEVERLLTDYKLSTLLLAQKLESLPKDEYHAIIEQIDRVLEREERLRDAVRSTGNVTLLDRARR